MDIARHLSVIDTGQTKSQLAAQGYEDGSGSPSRCRGYRLEVCSSCLDEMMEDLGPVFPGIPGDFAGGINLDGHDLADAGTLDDDNEGANATGGATPLFASLNIADDEGVADVCSGNDVCGGYRKSV